MNKDIKQITTAFTHGGIFHADDVFSPALLKMLNPDIEIIRGFQVPSDFQGIVYDIGGGEFDHHQLDKELRDNGVPYAAFGLLWRTYGHIILDEADVEEFDRIFVEKLDYSDNTGAPNILSTTISMMNPCWNEERSNDEAFAEAVEFAVNILQKYFSNYVAKREANSEVEKCITDSKILILPRFMPWKGVVCDRDIYYVIYPSNRSGYNVQAVPVSVYDKTLKKGFPKAWWGANVDTLKELTRVSTVTFCHTSGFMCAVGTLEDAIKLAELSLEVD